MIRPVITACGKALLSQLHPRMLMLTILPFLLSVALWGVVLYFTLQPMTGWVEGVLGGYEWFRALAAELDTVGAGFARYLLVSMAAMWLFLPLVILTALVFIAVFAMPAIIRHVATRHYPALERRHGGSLLGSLWLSLWTFAVFALLWIASLPLALLPPAGVVVQALLWGWLTWKVLSYDALAEHADREELRIMQRRHRWPLLAIGTATGLLGAAPMALWLGGALSVIFFPVFAAFSIWLYVLVFVFTGLWFVHYCLPALAALRAERDGGGGIAPGPATPALPPPGANGFRKIDRT